MDDDGLDDLLDDMEDLDAALFGKKKPAPAATNMLSSILSNPSSGPRPTVSFLEDEKPKRTPPAKSSFDDLFGKPAEEPRAAPAPARPSSNLSNLFGSRSTPAPAQNPIPAAPVQAPVVQQSHQQPPADSFETNRIQKLDMEIDRLNREIDDLRKRKRDDEEDLERIWKSRIDKLEKDHAKQIEQLRENQVVQMEKLENDHKIELDRMNQNYNRQLDGLTTSVGQTQDIVSIVDKVDTISANISKIAGDVSSNNNKVQNEVDFQLRLREEALDVKERKLTEDQVRFDEERKRVHELNFQLNEMVKKQKSSFDNDKWKIREEFQKLEAERQIFKDDQQFVLENIAVEKNQLEKQVTNFHQSQHDLLIRISTERQLLEQEKNEFYTKRNLDIRRIKNEASDLDVKIQQVGSVERNLNEIRKKYSGKLEQLQALEVSLMEECVEIDRIRNHVRVNAQFSMQEQKDVSNFSDAMFDVSYSARDSHRKNESVRATLRKHADYLDRYVGQKVATVAPQNN